MAKMTCEEMGELYCRVPPIESELEAVLISRRSDGGGDDGTERKKRVEVLEPRAVV